MAFTSLFGNAIGGHDGAQTTIRRSILVSVTNPSDRQEMSKWLVDNAAGINWFEGDDEDLVPLVVFNEIAKRAAVLKTRCQITHRVTKQKTQNLQRVYASFGALVSSATTLREAFQSANEFARWNATGTNVWLATDEGQEWICRSPPVGNTAGVVSLELITLQQMINTIQLAAGPTWYPKEIRVMCSKTKFRNELNFFHNARFRFNQSCTGVAVPGLLMTAKLATNSEFSQTKIRQRLLETWPVPSFAGSLAQVLEPLLAGAAPKIEIAAEISGMSVRTLQRRLDAESLTYRLLLDHARLKRARRFLATTDKSIGEISYLLGYSEPPNFIRSFKRISGLKPSQVRSHTATKPT